MSTFTNKDIRRLFLILSCVLASFTFLSQLYFWFTEGAPDWTLLLLSLFLAASVLTCCLLYFRRQQQMIESAISQIRRFTSGDRDVRIDSGSEGSLFKLFHEVNTLATTLNAHAVREQNTKDFLRNTISDISHQLKTPLAALDIYNSLLQEESGDEEAVMEFALKSERELERIETLVHNLLKITRLDAGAIVMNQHTQNISEMMNALKSSFETRARQEHKEILLSGPSDAALFCDRDWLMEAVSNIVKNALDHTDEDGRICIEWSSLPTIIQIVVKDNGKGIHPQDIHHIFKRFYRSRFSKDTQGAGLGLPLSKAIVEAHGGSLSVDSAPGSGSTFVLNFLNLTKL